MLRTNKYFIVVFMKVLLTMNDAHLTHVRAKTLVKNTRYILKTKIFLHQLLCYQEFDTKRWYKFQAKTKDWYILNGSRIFRRIR